MASGLRFFKSRIGLIVSFLFLFALIPVSVALGCWQYSHYCVRNAIEDFNADRLPEARAQLKRALAYWPWNENAEFWAGRSARVNGDLTSAEGHFNRCIKLNGGATERVQLEFLLMRAQAGEIDMLATTLFGLVEQNGGHPDGLQIIKTLGKVYMKRLRFRPAYACMSKWIEMTPDDPLPYHYRGWVSERLSNSKQALADFLKSLELDPNQIETRLRVVEMFLDEKKAPEAMPHAEFLYKLYPNDPRVQARMGMCLFLMGQKNARELMEAAVKSLPDDPSLLVSLANADLQDNRPVEAEKRLRKILETDPSDTEAMFVLSTALQGQGRTEESEAVLKSCIEKRKIVDRIHELLKDNADTPTAGADVYVEIGDLFLKIGREKFGVYWVEQAFDKDPSNQRGHKILASYYEKKGDMENATLHRRQIRPSSNGS
ncbi:MAG: tetratricopeptide repeat protein [Gemmataceae bacterium]